MSTSGRRRHRPLLVAAIIGVAGGLGPSALAEAATSHQPPSTHQAKKKTRHRSRSRPRPAKPLTNAQILALIKKNEKPGPPGPGGPTGPAGASAGYAAVGAGGPVGTSPTTVVSKSLPAGNFLIAAKTVLSGTSSSAGQVAVGACDLYSSASTSKLDSAQWDQPLGELLSAPLLYGATTTLPTQAAVALASPANVTLQCYSSGPSVGLTASFPSLQAVQVATAG